jgi:hypothetical protein
MLLLHTVYGNYILLVSDSWTGEATAVLLEIEKQSLLQCVAEVSPHTQFSSTKGDLRLILH